MKKLRPLPVIENARRAFRTDTAGSVLPLAALCIVPLLGIVALAIDYGRATSAKTQLQFALDSATLGAAKTLLTEGARPERIVTDYITTNFTRQASGLTPNIATQMPSQNMLRATASVDVPTTFAQVIGMPSLKVNLQSVAKFGLGSAEIALVLDNTGSMDGAKLDGLKQAASSLVDVLFQPQNASQSVKIGLVPFTYYVNVGTEYRNAAWMDVAHDSSTTGESCWDTYPDAVYSNPVTVTDVCYNDGVGSPCSYTSYTVDWGRPVQACGPVTTTTAWNGCVGSRAYPADLGDTADASNRVPGIMDVTCSSPIQRLSNSPTTVKNQINSMVATGETYIASGLLWGWRLLSPNPPFADGAANSADLRKIMVLMTDGANTKSPNYPDHEGGDVALADQLTGQLCTNIKQAGITIYTIAFAVSDPATADRLAACSSGQPFTYSASTVSQLQDAFRSIGNQLVTAYIAR